MLKENIRFFKELSEKSISRLFPNQPQRTQRTQRFLKRVSVFSVNSVVLTFWIQSKKILPKTKKHRIILILTILILISISGAALLLHRDKAPQEKPVPSVSIGCDRVLWKNNEIELAASTKNIDKP